MKNRTILFSDALEIPITFRYNREYSMTIIVR